MKKQILALIACLMLVMSTTAQAVTLRAIGDTYKRLCARSIGQN